MLGNAGQLYDSVHREIFSLDPDTQIFPGRDLGSHGTSSCDDTVAVGFTRVVHTFKISSAEENYKSQRVFNIQDWGADGCLFDRSI